MHGVLLRLQVGRILPLFFRGLNARVDLCNLIFGLRLVDGKEALCHGPVCVHQVLRILYLPVPVCLFRLQLALNAGLRVGLVLQAELLVQRVQVRAVLGLKFQGAGPGGIQRGVLCLIGVVDLLHLGITQGLRQ